MFLSFISGFWWASFFGIGMQQERAFFNFAKPVLLTGMLMGL
jgi:hypothetical protein